MKSCTICLSLSGLFQLVSPHLAHQYLARQNFFFLYNKVVFYCADLVCIFTHLSAHGHLHCSHTWKGFPENLYKHLKHLSQSLKIKDKNESRAQALILSLGKRWNWARMGISIDWPGIAIKGWQLLQVLWTRFSIWSPTSRTQGNRGRHDPEGSGPLPSSGK